MIELAKRIAREAHAGQFRRDGITPYITHVEAVAAALEGEAPEIIAAGWLHDVIEDTHLTWGDLLGYGVPEVVVGLVVILTDWVGDDYDRYIEGIAQSEAARKIKRKDIGHNLSCDPTDKQRAKYERALKILDDHERR